MARKRICVYGHFAFGKELLNGQTIKTKIITEQLINEFGKDQVMLEDTGNRWKTLFRMPFQLWRIIGQCDNLVILPAYKGVRVMVSLLALYSILGHKTTVHYAIIGAWLPTFIDSKKYLALSLKHVDYMYAETQTMLKALNERGYYNVQLMPNCKDIRIISEDEFPSRNVTPLKLCTFSRVMRQKGIDDIVSVIRRINDRHGETVFTLDIFGPIFRGEDEWFNRTSRDFPEYIRYGGPVASENSVNTLKDFFLLIFPSRFYTEGVPGTIIDAFAAGLPALSVHWESFDDVVDEGVNGISYPFGDNEALERELEKIAGNPDIVYSLKPACLKKAHEFKPQNIIRTLVLNIR